MKLYLGNFFLVLLLSVVAQGQDIENHCRELWQKTERGRIGVQMHDWLDEKLTSCKVVPSLNKAVTDQAVCIVASEHGDKNVRISRLSIDSQCYDNAKAEKDFSGKKQAYIKQCVVSAYKFSHLVNGRIPECRPAPGEGEPIQPEGTGARET